MVEILHKHNNNDPELTILDVIELLEQIGISPGKAYMDLSRELDSYANKHSRCRECGKELVQKIHNEKHEAYGSGCTEEIITLECEEHGEN